MGSSVNDLRQPIGELVDGWVIPNHPHRIDFQGSYCQLQPLNAEAHSSELFEAFSQDETGENWTYLPYGPFKEFEQFHAWVLEQSKNSDPLFFAVVDASSGAAVGVASFMSVAASMGSIELGHIHFSPKLQGTAAATEVLYLMLEQVFVLGYRRCEWKCNALNQASRNAALRLGFSFEGVFRQAAVIKGRNRDTAWFSMLDKEWPLLRQAFETWLSAENFSSGSAQKQRLSELTANAIAKIEEPRIRCAKIAEPICSRALS